MRTRAQIVERAALHVGHKETAPNDSILIRAWLRRCGVDKPAPWCAAFASWCLEDRNMAGALKLGRSFPETHEPQPGDLMYFATDDRGHGHVGVVVDVLPTLVLCIEGNSANRVRYVIRRRSDVRFANTRPGERAEPTTELLQVWDKAPLVEVSYEGTR